ncbi:hypothetical protein BDV09DRAFT_157016 [Aspergillus tetrazonus]
MFSRRWVVLFQYPWSTSLSGLPIFQQSKAVLVIIAMSWRAFPCLDLSFLWNRRRSECFLLVLGGILQASVLCSVVF